MSALTVKLESLLTRGKGTEQRIAQFLLEYRDSLVAMNAAELAQAAGVSSASVIRFARQMGYRGYPEFKVDYLSDEKQHKAESLYGNLSRNDDTAQIIAKSGQLFISAIEKSLELLEPAAVDAVAQKLVEAKRIVLFGIGSSAIVANDIFHKFIRVNKSALFSPDLHVQLSYSANLGDGDLAIAVTARGNTPEVNRMLKSAHDNGCTTIALTRFGQDDTARLADLILPYYYDEQHSQLGVITPQVLQMVIFDTLFFKYLTLANEDADIALQKGRQAVTSAG
ncbi:MurR/RpiR family transcriptional regulator [Providencia alcalifaciens]|uniref:MurR/RpiR family transcriptional regulator n=1 Tax=Providencia alcalifaciens TaxID=126385 RepID=UPI001CC7DC25|nr:MurR/RpiR family transcriptional regulator [Providencia alcalifaciens]CAG9412819.1 putative HTH-type transcriptional regulator YbbH [Providencia alcalifaciens]CAG9413775.1 putative HTH-type transcriptional regulator YbbH [Providencia alcalifaciens]CAG9413925.1 putative HTH-type transcriptional regulator YbbH [Providencia alcalifaciens]CAG9428195.1 putative HTH-type transcriptional regulator YbbH [Providencia alcalifaciens]CAG9436546.1 putative HTH-type transcriptional regulator YbbH [Provid